MKELHIDEMIRYVLVLILEGYHFKDAVILHKKPSGQGSEGLVVN